MTILTEKYVRKPLYVEAINVTEDNFVDVARWCQGQIRTIEDESVIDLAQAENGQVEETEGDESSTFVPKEHYIRVRVHKPMNDRQTQAHVGDWILYTDRGYKVYNHKAFKASFDPA